MQHTYVTDTYMPMHTLIYKKFWKSFILYTVFWDISHVSVIVTVELYVDFSIRLYVF